MPRFSLKTLLIAVAVIPLAAYCLVRATPLIASLVATLGVLLWIASLVVWLGSDGGLRDFSRGFVVASLAFAIATWGTGSIYGNHRLITFDVLSQIYQLVVVETQLKLPFGTGTIQFPAQEPFSIVGQTYWCLMVGLAGGWLAAWLYHRRQKVDRVGTEASHS